MKKIKKKQAKIEEMVIEKKRRMILKMHLRSDPTINAKGDLSHGLQSDLKYTLILYFCLFYRIWGLNCGSPTNYGCYRKMYRRRPHLLYNGNLLYLSKLTLVLLGLYICDFKHVLDQ